MDMNLENGFRPQNFSEREMKEEIEKILKNSKDCKECQPSDDIRNTLMSTLDDDEMFSDLEESSNPNDFMAKQINEMYQKQMNAKKANKTNQNIDQKYNPTTDDKIDLTNKETVKDTHTNSNGFWKFNEDKTLEKASQYIQSTYHQHYTSEESKVQVLDIIEAIGDGVPFCRDNLIKYSARFGKKNGFSKLDAMKIIHYGILLYNFAGFHKDTTNRYETF